MQQPTKIFGSHDEKIAELAALTTVIIAPAPQALTTSNSADNLFAALEPFF